MGVVSLSLLDKVLWSVGKMDSWSRQPFDLIAHHYSGNVSRLLILSVMRLIGSIYITFFSTVFISKYLADFRFKIIKCSFDF